MLFDLRVVCAFCFLYDIAHDAYKNAHSSCTICKTGWRTGWSVGEAGRGGSQSASLHHFTRAYCCLVPAWYVVRKSTIARHTPPPCDRRLVPSLLSGVAWYGMTSSAVSPLRCVRSRISQTSSRLLSVSLTKRSCHRCHRSLSVTDQR